MPDVIDAFITFYDDWQEVGTGPDGLPLYENVLMICLAKPPLTERRREATDYDKQNSREAYEEYLRQRKAHDPSVKGYPLSMWPVVSKAELQMCLARDIVTVEQLATHAASRDTPPQITELAKRAKKLVELQGKTGKYETIINELTAERDAVMEQLKEANNTISAQNSMIAMLQQAAVPRQVA